jgi:hypothetical protein
VIYIPIEIDENEIRGIGSRSGEDWKWALLSPTDFSDQYELTTIDLLPVSKKKLLININSRTAKRIG